VKRKAQVQAQYVVDAEGNPVAVILDIKVYPQLLEAWEEREAIWRVIARGSISDRL